MPVKVIQLFTRIFYKPLLVKYLAKERPYSFRSIHLRIPPQVFHPGFFFSTRLLLKYTLGLNLTGKTILELGAGSGLISIAAARAGAIVTATDINPVAVRYLAMNAKANRVDLDIIESDLFKKIPQQSFGMIVINPPYYLKKPVSDLDYAWYCGENGEYFRDLFASIGNYISKNTVILMILCEGCDREMIQAIARESGFLFTCVKTAQNLIEKNFIYQIHPTAENQVLIPIPEPELQ
jgi:release factor glutamine methyltransferase